LHLGVRGKEGNGKYLKVITKGKVGNGIDD